MEVTGGVKAVESLRRGLDVLLAIHNSSAATLTELQRQLGMPKATLLRMLRTLREAGWVQRDELHGRYMPAAAQGDTGAVAHWRARLSALASPLRTALQKHVPWPTDLAVRDGNAMLILDAHRPINGLAVNYRVLGFRPSMMVSSLGRCYLAYCPEDERRALLARLSRSTRAMDRLALRAGAVKSLVERTRSQGYATRDASPTSADSPERFGALSVPVFGGQSLIACLSCAWLPAVAGEREVAAAYLPAIQACAAAIGQRAVSAQLGLPP